MSREHRLFLDDMLKACDKVMRFTQGASIEQFRADEKTFDAVMRDLEIIGEAAKHIPDEMRRQHPEIHWRQISGFRDIVAHEYFGLDMEVVWDVVTRQVPTLHNQLKRLLD